MKRENIKSADQLYLVGVLIGEFGNGNLDLIQTLICGINSTEHHNNLVGMARRTRLKEIPTWSKAQIFFRLGQKYSLVGQRRVARQFILKAISTNLHSKQNVFYLISALANGDSSLGRLLLSIYITLVEFSLRFFKKLGHSRGREFFNLTVPYD
jgi:hypothetical protein